MLLFPELRGLPTLIAVGAPEMLAALRFQEATEYSQRDLHFLL